MSAKDTITSLLAVADIKVNGSRPFDIQVHDERFYRRVLTRPQLALGETYMDGWWDVKRLDELLARVLSADLQKELKFTPAAAKTVLTAIVSNRQTASRAKKNAAHHYNIGNDLYERMLGKRMIYSCGYWKKAKNLDEAQVNKLDLICRKLHLEKGMTILDIGCGWGGFSEFAARNYGVKVTGISPAAEQVKLAKKRVKGLDVKILKRDYRDIRGQFDRIVSVGMLEHVGPKNYRNFFEVCDKLLKDDGLMLHHFISNNRSLHSTNPWVDKYIFPGGVLPSPKQVAHAIEGRFIIEDVENFGPYYDKTLLAWHANFVKYYPEIKEKYDDRFYRMWSFYLLGSAAMFRTRHIQLLQFVMRKPQASPVYKRV